MKQQALTKVFAALFVVFVVLGSWVLADAATPEELRTSIEARARELNDINKQITETQTKLSETAEQKKSLTKEIQSIDYSIKQLTLGIRSSEISIEKLSLELQKLSYDIEIIQQSVDKKKQAIGKFLQTLWEKEQEGLIVILLKNRSLAESILESETIHDLNAGLAIEVRDLKTLNGELAFKFDETATKRGGVELENRNLKNRKEIVADKKVEQTTILNLTKTQEKQYQTEITDLGKRQESIGQEIAKLEDALRAAFDPTLLPTKRPGVFGSPVESVFITQAYGRTRFAERAYKTGEHNGIDFRASVGTPIFAAEDGTVWAANDNGRLQYGKYVLVKHDNNLATLYAHLSRQIVREGAIVKRGDLIGYAGATGYATGPHLHFSVYWAPSVELKNFPGAGLVPIGVTVNPEEYL
jgi:murein DD-endopeptidase MepM/ murein hydrolase activator NlpD